MGNTHKVVVNGNRTVQYGRRAITTADGPFEVTDTEFAKLGEAVIPYSLSKYAPKNVPSELSYIDQKTVGLLKDNKIFTSEQIIKAGEDKLAAIHGISKQSAKQIVGLAKEKG